MVNSGNVIELTMVAEEFGVKFHNVFFFLLVGGDASLQDIFDGWTTSILPTYLDFFRDSTTVVEVKIRDLFDASEQETFAVALAGLLTGTGEAMPAWNTVNYVMNHDNPAVKAGGKRFGSLGEASVVGGTGLSGTMTTLVANIAAVLALGFAAAGGGGGVLGPVVVGRILVAVGKYRLPETLAEMVIEGFGLVVEAVFKKVGHQVSREPST